MIPAFLENALALDSIPVPKQDISSDKFTRWGKNDCFWAKAVCNGFIYGDFSKAVSKSVFPQAPEHLSRAFVEMRRKAVEQERLEARRQQECYWAKCAQRAQKIWNGGETRSNASVFNPQENQRQRFENNRVAFADYSASRCERENLDAGIHYGARQKIHDEKRFEKRTDTFQHGRAVEYSLIVGE